MSNRASLTEGSISHRLFMFAIPILVGNVLQTLNGSVNSVWIGHFLGEAALTASANASIILFLVLAAMIGASMAATMLIGQYLGAHRGHEAKRVVGTSATFALTLSVVMAAVGFAICRPVLHLMQTPMPALEPAVAYTRVIFLALPFMVLYVFATSVLRGAGDARTPLYFLFLSVGLDIGLNPVFIFGLGPAPRLGIAGSAVATLLAQAISLVALVTYLYRIRHPLCLHRGELALLRLDWRIVGVLVGKGVPLALQMVVASLSMVLMISLVNRYGIDTASAFGAAVQIWNYIQMPAFAIGMAVASMAAQNIGAQKWDRVRTITRIGVLYQFLLTGSIVLLLDLVASHVLGLFLPRGSAAVQIAVHLNTVVAWSFVFFGVSLVLFGVVRANGSVFAPLIILVVALLGVRFPLALALLGRLHADAIWWSFPISSLLSLLLALLYYRFGRWREVRLIGPAGAVPAGAAAAADP
ncbi:MAG TPA: MATE family efflux transporter [Steroidobacteraceae bacterium]|nr:MATE family efflux transporter [Steroidobacteraceae bacterium]